MSKIQSTPELFEALSHKRRIQILNVLRDKSYRFSELKRALGIKSSGNLTHHLTKLVNLIKINESGLYILSDLGRDVLLAVELGDQRNRKILVKISIFFSTTIFYGIFLTFAVILDKYLWVLLGLGCTFIFHLVFSWVVKKKIKKGNFKFIFGFTA